MFSFFESAEKKLVKSHIRHLVRLAQSDGVVHKKEEKFIKKVGRENGLSDSDIKKIIDSPTSVDIVIPKSKEAKFDQLFDLVVMMLKDDEVNDAETDFCMMLANRLGFRKIIVGVLVSKIQRGISEGLSKKEILKEAEAFINY